MKWIANFGPFCETQGTEGQTEDRQTRVRMAQGIFWSVLPLPVFPQRRSERRDGIGDAGKRSGVIPPTAGQHPTLTDQRGFD